MHLPETFKLMRIERFVAGGFIHIFNKSVFIFLTDYVNLAQYYFLAQQPIKIAERSTQILSIRMAFNKYLLSNLLQRYKCPAADKLTLILLGEDLAIRIVNNIKCFNKRFDKK